MTFDKQVKEAEKKKLQNRITRDIVFLALGASFLIISILTAVKDQKSNNKDITTTPTRKVIAEKK